IIPPDTSFLRKLKDAGAERVGIAVDAGSRDLYDRVKGRSAGGPTDWDEVWNSMDEALSIFGKGMASTHLIIGLGETDREVFDVMERCLVKGVLLSLFAYTPMKGTSFYADPPPLGRYRAMQVVRHLVIQEGILDGFRFDEKEKLVGVPEMDSISGSAFMTRGCPDCNRPYYNERPRGPIYNHPRKPSGKEVEKALRDVKEYVEGTR
ncbi:MAG: radical SAM protein, partial [Thermoplasmatota archaeon]